MNQEPKLSRGKRLLLKLISILFGFAFWYLFMHHQIGYQQIDAQLCFHDIPEEMSIKAPATVEIMARGNHRALHEIDHDVLSFHIDASKLAEGENEIALKDHQLFLPEHTQLLSCNPSTILVYVQKKT